jgi:allantoinase
VHAEDDTLIELISSELRTAGMRDPRAHAAAHPAASSLVAIHTAIALAAIAGCRLHVLHVDVAAAGQPLREARSAGQPVSAEAAIAFLTLEEEDYWRLGPYARFSPPLRSRQNQDGLWELLRDGTLSFVISDHSPYSAEVKEPGWEDIWGVPDGAPTLQLCYQLLLSEGVHKRGFPLPRFCALSSSNAARLFGCYPRKGSLQPGADADLALLDLDARWTVRAQELVGKHRWTPYEGRELRGRVISTVRRGELVYDRGELLAEPGSGRAW